MRFCFLNTKTKMLSKLKGYFSLTNNNLEILLLRAHKILWKKKKRICSCYSWAKTYLSVRQKEPWVSNFSFLYIFFLIRKTLHFALICILLWSCEKNEEFQAKIAPGVRDAVWTTNEVSLRDDNEVEAEHSMQLRRTWACNL